MVSHGALQDQPLHTWSSCGLVWCSGSIQQLGSCQLAGEALHGCRNLTVGQMWPTSPTLSTRYTLNLMQLLLYLNCCWALSYWLTFNIKTLKDSAILTDKYCKCCNFFYEQSPAPQKLINSFLTNKYFNSTTNAVPETAHNTTVNTYYLTLLDQGCQIWPMEPYDLAWSTAYASLPVVHRASLGHRATVAVHAKYRGSPKFMLHVVPVPYQLYPRLALCASGLVLHADCSTTYIWCPFQPGPVHWICCTGPICGLIY